jgi:hypothetical protein
MFARDYYSEARELATLLTADGLPSWATRFEEAITGGFTATDILMALRWEAQQLRAAELHLSTETSARLELLLGALGQALDHAVGVPSDVSAPPTDPDPGEGEP